MDVTEERRNRADRAHQIEESVDERCPEAERVVPVMDNLNTHPPASPYEAFEPEEARRLAEKPEIRYTPKRGSWLDMAERSSRAYRVGSASRPTSAGFRAPPGREVGAWQERRNAAGGKIDRRFTTEEAGIKLKRLYPSLQE